MPKPAQTAYWSSCCGAPADYAGFYRCTGCKSALNFGRLTNPHLVGDPHEAARIRRQLAGPAPAEPEAVVPDGCLF